MDSFVLFIAEGWRNEGRKEWTCLVKKCFHCRLSFPQWHFWRKTQQPHSRHLLQLKLQSHTTQIAGSENFVQSEGVETKNEATWWIKSQSKFKQRQSILRVENWRKKTRVAALVCSTLWAENWKRFSGSLNRQTNKSNFSYNLLFFRSQLSCS